MGKCSCGRSPPGLCIGWHALTKEEYEKKERQAQMTWKNHEEDPMEQMRRAFLAEIKDLKNKNDLLKKQVQEEVKEKYSLYKRIKELKNEA